MNKLWWRVQANRAYEELRARQPEMTIDDLLELIGHPDDHHSPNAANNAIGALIRDWHKAGLIEPTGRVTKSRQPHRKGGIVQIWRFVDAPTLFDHPGASVIDTRSL